MAPLERLITPRVVPTTPGPAAVSPVAAATVAVSARSALAAGPLGVHLLTSPVAKPSTAIAFSSAVNKSAAATTAAAVVAPPPSVSVSPLQGVLNVVTNALLSLGGLSHTTPTPAQGNFIQLALYSVARWLQDTFNPGGIPKAGTPTIGTPNPTTGLVTFNPVFTDAVGAPLTYQATTDPALGAVSVNADGVYSYTPNQAARLGAPANGGGTAQVTVTAFNGVQSVSQIITVPVSYDAVAPGVTAEIPVGGSPEGVAVSPDGTHLVVTNTLDGTVSVINTANNTVTATIPVGGIPNSVAISNDGNLAYVANGKTVSVLSLKTNSVATTISASGNPTQVAIGPANTPAAGRLYVADYKSLSVSEINTATNTVTTTLPEGLPPLGMTFSRDGLFAYVVFGDQYWTGNPLNYLTTVTPIPTKKYTYPPDITITGSFTGTAVAVSNDGTRLYLANGLGTDVKVINVATGTVTATITVGASPFAMAVSPDGSVLYVTNETDNTVSLINTATNTVITTVHVGLRPEGLAVSPDGTHVYVADSLDNAVVAISV